MTKTRQWQSFRMPVNASSFGQADRKEEKVSGYKSNKRGGGESSK